MSKYRKFKEIISPALSDKDPNSHLLECVMKRYLILSQLTM